MTSAIVREAWLVAVVLAASGAADLACRSATAAEGDAAARPIELHENLQYGSVNGEPLTLHLARPAGDRAEGSGAAATPATSARPAVLVIHGGGWQGGNKDIHLREVRQLAERGYVAVSVGYRLAPRHHFPAAIEDCKCAVRWLRAHAAEWEVDPQRIGAMGFSAGAHLALLLGTTDENDGLEGEGGWPDQSSRVQVVVSFAGPTNLLAELPEISVPIVEAFLGGPASEMAERYRLASPVALVDATDAPALLFQGTVDELVPYTQAIELAEAMTQAGVPGRVELLVGAGHGWSPREAERTLDAAAAFLDEHLQPERDK